MAKNPLSQVELPDGTVMDVKDNTLVAGDNITITTNSDGERVISAAGGGSGAGFPEIKDTNHVVIWNLDPGIYIYSYPNGTSGYGTYKYIHFYGTNSTTASYRIDLSDQAPILLYISKSGSQKNWSFVSGGVMYGGYSTISGGNFGYKEDLTKTLHTISIYDNNSNSGSFTMTVKIRRTSEYTSTQWKAALEAIRTTYGTNKAIPCSGVITYALDHMTPGVPVILHSARIYQDSNYKYCIEFGGCDIDNGSSGLYTCHIEADWTPVLFDVLL